MIKSAIICDHCSKQFSSKSSLTNHQKTAKYCLDIQGKNLPSTYKCKGCGKEFTRKYHFDRHGDKCIFYVKYISKRKENVYKQKIKKQKRQIKMLQRINKRMDKKLSENKGKIKVLEDGSTRPINNTTYNNSKLLTIKTDNISPLTYYNVFENVNEGMYTKEMFDRGISGIVEFISNMIIYENDSGEIERNYACTDTSRHKFHRLIDTNEWKSDNGAHFLTDILDCIEPEVNRHYNDLIGKRTKAHIIGDEEEYAHCNSMVQKMKPLYRGVKSKKGEPREKLFGALRNQIGQVASV